WQNTRRDPRLLATPDSSCLETEKFDCGPSLGVKPTVMSINSKIEWTDATWNPIRGCTKISPGCKNCYAEAFAERFRGVKNHPYEQGFDLRLVPDKLAEPLRWRTPKMVFVNSMSDLFYEGIPDDYIDAIANVMVRSDF